MERVFLLTGAPGTGKTSIIKQAAARLGESAGGFYTEEIRSAEGNRKGFKLVALDGREAVLAQVNIKGRYRVGKYGVDIGALESIGVQALKSAAGQGKIIVVDEIGRMELLSPKFREAINRLLDDGQFIIGTIMMNSHPFADAVKRRPGVRVVPVTGANNCQVTSSLEEWLTEITKGESNG